jgi:8-oxo-dGTP diphosphatase
MKEEMGIDLKEFLLFCIREFDDRIEYMYWKKEDLKIEEIHLTEGQRLRWFTEAEARTTPLAYGFNEIVADFFAEEKSEGIDRTSDAPFARPPEMINEE